VISDRYLITQYLITDLPTIASSGEAGGSLVTDHHIDKILSMLRF
jgi:hypothetical protein